MIEARPSMTEPSAHPIREIELAAMPATRPRTPSPVIQASENQARAFACWAACSHPAASRVASFGVQQAPDWPSASPDNSGLGAPVPGLAVCGCSSMGVVFVLAVAGRFELEGGVFDVKVPDKAGLHLIQEPGGVPVVEAAIVDDHVRRQGGQVGGDRPDV